MEIRLEEYEYYIRPGYTDMRKQSRRLSILVQDTMNLEPFRKSVFIFCGRSRRILKAIVRILKAIVWDGNGWIEIIKRIECNERFFWPRDEEEARKATLQQVMGLLAGYNVWRPLPELSPEAVG